MLTANEVAIHVTKALDEKKGRSEERRVGKGCYS